MPRKVNEAQGALPDSSDPGIEVIDGPCEL